MFSRLLSFYLTGFVIKLMDDYLDQDLARLKEEWNFAEQIGRAILPYSLVIFIAAVYFNFEESVSLFAASYLVGMFYGAEDKLPSRLRGWQEGILVFLLSVYVTSLQNTVASLLLIILIQFVDDYLDYSSDLKCSRKNYIYSMGMINSVIIFTIILLLVLRYFPVKLLYFSSAAALLYLTFSINIAEGENAEC